MNTAGLYGFGLILLGYLSGSIPTGYLIAKYLKNIDIREYGSGSTGATNVLRNVGKIPALFVLIIDLLKGIIVVSLVKVIYTKQLIPSLPESWQPWLIILTALAAILGHSKSIWLKFSGGKSVAVGLGVMFVVNPLVAVLSLSTFLLVLGVSRIVSLSSISGAIAVTISMLILNQPLPYLLFGVLAGLYVVIRHKTNIERILAGEEPRIGQSATPTTN